MTLLAVGTRSGLIETTHQGAVAVVSPEGELVASAGDIDRPYYLRSAAKPFQALVAQQAGAGLSALQLAMASASHDGDPVHVSLVESMLAEAGLTVSDLGCPASWPLSEASRMRLAGAGVTGPRPVWHNCSGKHAAWLRACRSNGWTLDGYLEPSSPLQRQIADTVSELGRHSAEPVGVDGCGAPVLRTTARAMARLYAALACSDDLGEVYTAMHRYPALVSGGGNGDAVIATVIDAVAKKGAQGCLGVAVRGRFGIAVKSWDGLHVPAVVGAVAALRALGVLGGFAVRELETLARPPVTGGSEVVGHLEPRLELDWS